MKPKAKAIGLAGLGLIIVGVIALAVLHSQSYDAPDRPAVSVAQLERQLQQTAPQPTAPTTSQPPTASSPTTKATASAPLPATGPDNVVLLFAVATFAGFAFSEANAMRTRRANKPSAFS